MPRRGQQGWAGGFVQDESSFGIGPFWHLEALVAVGTAAVSRRRAALGRVQLTGPRCIIGEPWNQPIRTLSGAQGLSCGQISGLFQDFRTRAAQLAAAHSFTCSQHVRQVAHASTLRPPARQDSLRAPWPQPWPPKSILKSFAHVSVRVESQCKQMGGKSSGPRANPHAWTRSGGGWGAPRARPTSSRASGSSWLRAAAPLEITSIAPGGALLARSRASDVISAACTAASGKCAIRCHMGGYATQYPCRCQRCPMGAAQWPCSGHSLPAAESGFQDGFAQFTVGRGLRTRL